jgi:hypothetical protein
MKHNEFCQAGERVKSPLPPFSKGGIPHHRCGRGIIKKGPYELCIFGESDSLPLRINITNEPANIALELLNLKTCG